jgi:hypothetical protein
MPASVVIIVVEFRRAYDKHARLATLTGRWASFASAALANSG